MPLQRSGAISLNDVNLECGFSGTATIGLNDSRPRTLTSKASGQISLNDCYGCMYMTEGTYAVYTYYGTPLGYYYGYFSGATGSLGRDTFPGGQTVYYCMDDTTYGGFTLSIVGFAADPGQTGFWSTLQRGTGTTINSAGATTYIYSGGQAIWLFSGAYIGAAGGGATAGYKWT